MSTNALRTLPASIGRLRKIQRINAANNMLVRVPPSMGHLKTIKELNLRWVAAAAEGRVLGFQLAAGGVEECCGRLHDARLGVTPRCKTAP